MSKNCSIRLTPLLQLLAPGTQQAVGGGDHEWFAVCFARVLVHCSSGLGPEVAESRVEVQGADAVSAMRTGELHAALDAFDAIRFHCLDCMRLRPQVKHAMVTQRR